MKRSSDDIRKLILEILNREGKTNLESIRLQIDTGLPTMLNNLKALSNWGFVNVYKAKFGERCYREIELTELGKEFLNRTKVFKEKFKS